MTIFIFLLFLLSVIYGKNPTENCESHDPCRGYAGQWCSIGDYFQIVVRLNAITEERYYPFCVKVDEIAELYLPYSFSWVKGVADLDANIEAGNPPTMSIMVPRKDDSKYPRMESLSWPIIGKTEEGEYTWPRRFTLTVNLRWGSFLDYAADTFEFEDMCSGEKCKEFSKSKEDDYLCVKKGDSDEGVTCTVVEGSGLEEDLYPDIGDSSDRPLDVKIFLAFAGSDSKGSALKSESYLPSKLRYLSFYTNVETGAYDLIDTA